MIEKIFKKRGLFKKPKYDRNNFRKEWSNISEDITFGEVKTKLMMTTVDLVSDTNIFYKSWRDDNKNIGLVDLIERSFAAPLYFGQINDHVNQLVYSDGGIGNANFPLNEAKLQAEMFGWYSDGEELEIHAVGTLYDGYTPSFSKVSKGRWLTQVIDYMKPSSGGLARAQSRLDQLRMMEYICNRVPNIKFKYWDAPSDSKQLKLDGVKYIDYYKQLGKQMAIQPIISYN